VRSPSGCWSSADDHARPGSDIAAERPRSVESGLTLYELLDA